jgi:DNA-binding transcriptional LysR family regulator
MLEIETRQLEYFVTAAECKSISKAAGNLSVSQQALSKGIQSLERVLGKELFFRSKTGVSLTDFGIFFLRNASKTLEDLKTCKNAESDYAKGTGRKLLIGIPPLCFHDKGGTLKPKDIMKFQTSHSDIGLACIEMRPDGIRKNVKKGNLDFGIVSSPNSRDFDSVVLRQVSLAVLLGRDNPLSEKQSLTASELKGNSAVFIQGDRVVEGFMKILGEFNDFEVRASPLQTNSCRGSEYIFDETTMVIEPLMHARRTEPPEEVAVIPLVDQEGKNIEMPLSLIWRKDHAIFDIEQALIDYIINVYQGNSEYDRVFDFGIPNRCMAQ